jgi:hypothetical protein
MAPGPVEVHVRRVEDAPAHEARLGLLVRLVADEEALVVGVEAAVEAHVGAEEARAADGRVVVAPVARAPVEVVGVGQSLLLAVEGAGLLGVEERAVRDAPQSLRPEDGLLAETVTRVEAGDVVVLVHEVRRGAEEADVPLLADVALEAEHADRRVLVQDLEDGVAPPLKL